MRLRTPLSTHYDDNKQAAHKRANARGWSTHPDHFCYLCGKYIKNGLGVGLVVEDLTCNELVSNTEPIPYEQNSGPVGRECARKVPEGFIRKQV